MNICKCGHDEESHSMLLGVCGACYHEAGQTQGMKMETNEKEGFIITSLPQGKWNHLFEEQK